MSDQSNQPPDNSQPPDQPPLQPKKEEEVVLNIIEVGEEIAPSSPVETPRTDLTNLPPAEVDRFDLSRSQEETRATLARLVLYIQIGILVAIGCFVIATEIKSALKPSDNSPDKNLVKLGTTNSFIYVVKDKGETNDNKELLTLVWTAQVALVSGALGFYFGSKEIAGKQ